MQSFLVIVLALFLGSAGVSAEVQQVLPERVDVEDADTLRVAVGGISYRIQLPGVDAPESVANPKLQRDVERTGHDAEALLALGREADQGLRAILTEFAPFSLKFDPQKHDKYGRVPGELLDPDGQRLSVRLVAAGFAVPLRRGPDPVRQAELGAAMSAAREQRRGLWGSHADIFSAWAQPVK